jgi:hypothetical protein
VKSQTRRSRRQRSTCREGPRDEDLHNEKVIELHVEKVPEAKTCVLREANSPCYKRPRKPEPKYEDITEIDIESLGVSGLLS